MTWSLQIDHILQIRTGDKPTALKWKLPGTSLKEKSTDGENYGKDERKFDAPQMTSFRNVYFLQQMVNLHIKAQFIWTTLKFIKKQSFQVSPKTYFFN